MKTIKSFSLFESSDVLDILPVVKDMLLELSDLDYVTNCAIRRIDGRESIRIGISKPAIGDVVYGNGYNIKPSFDWNDIKDVIEPVIEYLKSEGYHYQLDKGTLSTAGHPIIVTTTPSNAYLGIRSRCEMWFEI